MLCIYVIYCVREKEKNLGNRLKCLLCSDQLKRHVREVSLYFHDLILILWGYFGFDFK